jgi:CubicO group peptidase (beta-lactamase class C family)
MDNHRRIQTLLEKGVTNGIYPGAVLLTARQGIITFFEAVGYARLRPEPVLMKKETIFDLASLTKPLATTLSLMKFIDKEEIGLDCPLSDILPASMLYDKKDLSLRLLLNHSAGFYDWKPFYLDLVKYNINERKKIIRQWIMEEPLAYRPGSECRYSDLGFIILEWIVEEVSGYSLKQCVDDFFYRPLGLKNLFLSINRPSGGIRKKPFAATEDCPWRKRILQGEVHDENAFALGGYSGHAGLFGDCIGVFQIVSLLREHFLGERADYLRQKTVKSIFKRQKIIQDSTWALGWDTPSERDSSSGHFFSSNSVGHLGYTGTSIWLDLEKDIIIIFLTNRIHPVRANQRLKPFRPILHDAIMEEYANLKSHP